jgi:hypothetical protein
MRLSTEWSPIVARARIAKLDALENGAYLLGEYTQFVQAYDVVFKTSCNTVLTPAFARYCIGWPRSQQSDVRADGDQATRCSTRVSPHDRRHSH